MAGRVVVLNGSSSAGKSSLARALQRRWAGRGEPWVIFGWDDFVPRLSDRWHGTPDHHGDLAHEGVAYRAIDEQTAVLDVGPLGQRMLSAYHRAVAAIATAGVHVLVDEVLMTAGEWSDWQVALDGLDVRWVAVRCDLEVVAAREEARGDRLPGLARGTGLIVHRHAVYDVEVDTTSLSTEDAAEHVDAALLGFWQ